MERITGNYQKLGDLKYFVPHPLPPKDPEFNYSKELAELYGETMYSVGKLNAIAKKLPNRARFIKAYLIKESVLSSAIEGINTTIAEIFTQEIAQSKTKINKQTQLVLNYDKALDYTLAMIQKENYPITSRILLKAHEILMSSGEGEKSDPGQYRKQQVRVGKFIPPAADKVESLIADLEKYINQDASLPTLIKAGLAHVQFETIHPFLDGNGRIGRLLIVLMLVSGKVLTDPILYPSVYFKKYHAEYYDRLDLVRTKGDFEGWIKFYLRCVNQSAIDGYQKIKDIENLEKNIVDTIDSTEGLFEAKDKLYKALNILFEMPVITITELQKKLEVSYNTAHKIITTYEKIGFIKQQDEKQRNKFYKFHLYLNILNDEVEQ